MKNYKYIKMTQEYLDDENLISLLQQQAKDGWLIKRIDHSYITFIECEPKTFKFQIDYVTITKEYKNVMTELGYRYLCSLDGMNIYCNEDLDAQDLYNDELTKIMSQLNYYKVSKIVNKMLWIFICTIQLYVIPNELYFRYYRHSLGQLYTRTSIYVLIGLVTFFLVLYTVDTLYLVYMRRYYKKQLKEEVCEKVKIKYLQTYGFIQKASIVILLFILPIIVLLSVMERYDLLRMSIVAGLTLALIGAVLMIFERHKLRNLIYSICIVISLGMGFGLYNMVKVQAPVKKLFYENKVNEIYLEEADDFLSNYKIIHIFHNDYYEKCVASINEVFSKEIFKEELITLDAYARKAITSNKYSTYEEVIKTMNVLEDERIDEGFYNYNYVVFRKDNIVVSFRRADVPMEEVIEYYLGK